MRICNSYTCGGVTCNYEKSGENVVGFTESPWGAGYIGGFERWVAEPPNNLELGGHRITVEFKTHTKIGCATYGDEKNGILYCRYPGQCTCYNGICCDSCYPDEGRNLKCKAAVDANLWYNPYPKPCQNFPNATDSIVASTPWWLASSSLVGATSISTEMATFTKDIYIPLVTEFATSEAITEHTETTAIVSTTLEFMNDTLVVSGSKPLLVCLLTFCSITLMHLIV